jgi:hypothetical protein
VLRLLIHYRKTHERREGTRRFISTCDCPGYAPAGDRLQARLHTLVGVGLLSRKLPTLPRIYRAIAEIKKSRERVA